MGEVDGGPWGLDKSFCFVLRASASHGGFKQAMTTFLKYRENGFMGGKSRRRET